MSMPIVLCALKYTENMYCYICHCFHNYYPRPYHHYYYHHYHYHHYHHYRPYHYYHSLLNTNHLRL
ncbi:CMP8R [Camelpox virus CMS]|uniref:CMP8R n=1 Tax=Camelpox virus (strain CMS) TaxID=203172 RepID=Q8QQ84_CAMPS|nr:CMP8R [Camelpox virus CMS]